MPSSAIGATTPSRGMGAVLVVAPIAGNDPAASITVDVSHARA